MINGIHLSLRVILGLLYFCSLHGQAKYPVDVCYMVADLKYNARQGVKICEVQQASLSVFNGDTFRGEEEESIHKEILRTLSLYNNNGWIVAGNIADKNLVSSLASLWHSPKDIMELVSNPNFMYEAKLLAADMYDMASYQGFLYINWFQLSAIHDFDTRFPGMIVLDKSSFPFWVDKYLMTKLFSEDPLLARYKPKWGNYKKKYTKELAAQIADDLECDMFVIKPRGECMGNGVIITPKEDLDDVLLYIITKKGKFAESQDAAYRSWKRDPFDSFIVEEFVASDPITIPHLDNKTYQPTMRIAFLLVYNNHQHDVHFLGAYWKTPLCSLEEEGDFMLKNKDICEPPYYFRVDQKTMQAVHDELRIALPLLHSKMLEYSSEYAQPMRRRNVEITLQEKAS